MPIFVRAQRHESVQPTPGWLYAGEYRCIVIRTRCSQHSPESLCGTHAVWDIGTDGLPDGYLTRADIPSELLLKLCGSSQATLLYEEHLF